MYRREASDFERALAGLGDERMWDRLRAALDAPSARARGER